MASIKPSYRLSEHYPQSGSAEEATASFAVSKMVRVPLTQHQHDSLVLFCLRLSVTTFFQSHLLRVINRGSFRNVPELFLKYCNDRKGLNKVMLAQRQEEAELFRKDMND